MIAKGLGLLHKKIDNTSKKSDDIQEQINGIVPINTDTIKSIAQFENYTLATNGEALYLKDAFFAMGYTDGSIIITGVNDASTLTFADLRVSNIGYKVLSILENAFLNCTALEKVRIPYGVRSITNMAFKGCTKLISVNLPNTVTLGTHNFEDCSSMVAVRLPERLEIIGSYNFSGCTSLKAIVIPDTVTYIGEHAFYNCTSLGSVIIPDGVTTIEADAFYGVPHIFYNGAATGAPWGAININ